MNYLRKKRIFRTLIFTLIIATSFSGICAVHAEDYFDRTEMSVKGTLRGKIFKDLNGDKLDDIIIFYTKGFFPNIKKFAGVFLQTVKGFSNEPDYNVVIPDILVLADMSDVTGNNNPELIMMGTGGVYYFRNNDGFFGMDEIRLINTETVISLPVPGGVLVYNFIREVNGFEDPLIIVPNKGEFGIYSGKPGMRYRQISRIKVKEDVGVREIQTSETPGDNPLYFSHRFPKIIFADLNGDGRDDLYSAREGTVDIFIASASGKYPYEPDKEIDFKIISQQEHEHGYGEATIMVTDINNDKIPDISAAKITGSVLSFNSSLKVYYGKKNSNYSNTPDFSLTTENASFAGFFRDFNGDGEKDILVPSMRLGVFGIVKLLLMKKVDMFMKIYLQKNNTFNTKPDYEKKITYRFDLDRGNVELNTSPDFDGDINGDDLNDLVINPGDNSIRIYLGSQEEVFVSDEYNRLQIDSPSFFKPIDLNGDKRSEIFISYENVPGRRGDMVILTLKESAPLTTD